MQRDTEIARLEQRVEELTRELNEKAADLDAANETIESLTAEVKSAKHGTQRQESRCRGLRSELHDTTQQSKATIAWLEASAEIAQSESDSLRSRCDKTTSDYCFLYDEYESMIAKVNQLVEDKEALDTTVTSLQTSLHQERETSERLQNEYNELKASQRNTVESIGQEVDKSKADIAMLRRARADLLQFLYNTFGNAPGSESGAFIDDDTEEIARITKEQLERCEKARDEMDDARKAVLGQLIDVQTKADKLIAHTILLRDANQKHAGLEAGLQGQIETAKARMADRDAWIAELTNDVAARDERIAALVAARQTALDEHIRVALALEQSEARYTNLTEFVKGTVDA